MTKRRSGLPHEISLKVHRTPNGVMLAACDYELLGKRFKEGELQLDVNENFYNDVMVDKMTFLKHLAVCTIANLIGDRVIKYAINAGYVNKHTVIHISGIPHVQILKLI